MKKTNLLWMKDIYSFTNLVIKKTFIVKKIKRALETFLVEPNITKLNFFSRVYLNLQTPPIHDFFYGQY